MSLSKIDCFQNSFCDWHWVTTCCCDFLPSISHAFHSKMLIWNIPPSDYYFEWNLATEPKFSSMQTSAVMLQIFCMLVLWLCSFCKAVSFFLFFFCHVMLWHCSWQARHNELWRYWPHLLRMHTRLWRHIICLIERKISASCKTSFTNCTDCSWLVYFCSICQLPLAYHGNQKVNAKFYMHCVF